MIFFLIFDTSLVREKKSKRFIDSDQTQISRQGRRRINFWWFL